MYITLNSIYVSDVYLQSKNQRGQVTMLDKIPAPRYFKYLTSSGITELFDARSASADQLSNVHFADLKDHFSIPIGPSCSLPSASRALSGS